MKNIVEKLKTEEKVVFTPHGNSMSPKIKNGEEVIVSRVKKDPVIGDIVLCKVKGRYLFHLVKAVKMMRNGKKFLIGNNKGDINGWIGIGQIFGVKI